MQIEDESSRVYTYSDGFRFKIMNPVELTVNPDTSHTVKDAAGDVHNLARGWRVLTVAPKVQL